MGRWRWSRQRPGQTSRAGEAREAGDLPDPTARDGDTRVEIDLTDGPSWSGPAEPDREQVERMAAELRARIRARAERAEAERDLQRLRARHWSGERVLEEGRRQIDWWEHPEADPYAVLGLLPGAPIEEAAAARRRIAQTYHPDRAEPGTVDPDEAIRRMVAANAAYDRLRRALHPI